MRFWNVWNILLNGEVEPEPPKVEFNPIDIATGKTNINKGIDGKDNQLIEWLDLRELYAILTDYLLYAAAIVILIVLISMMFVNKADILAEKKAKIMHVLLIVLFGSSLLAILNIFTNMLGSIF